MEDFVKKVIDFILFFVNAIKDMVAALTGKGGTTTPTDDGVSEDEPVSEG